jgi:quercetin dioxygenase-like cupin family protein
VPIIRKQDWSKREESFPGLEFYDIADAAQGTHSLKVGQVTIAPNTRAPRHIHTNTEEAMVVLEGTLDALVGSQRMTITAGDAVLAPAGTVHGFVNRYDIPARVLFIFPIHEPDRVLSSVSGATSGFLSERGLTGYSSPQDRPLEKQG